MRKPKLNQIVAVLRTLTPSQLTAVSAEVAALEARSGATAVVEGLFTAGALGVEHHAVNLSAGVRVNGAWHVQNVNAYHSRLKTGVRKFNGVATRYLENYLGGFRTLDRKSYNPSKPLPWLALADRKSTRLNSSHQ